AKRDYVGHIEAGQIAQLFGIARIGEDVVGTENRREGQKLTRQRRADARIPGPERGFGEIESGAQKCKPTRLSRDYVLIRGGTRAVLPCCAPLGRVPLCAPKCVIASISDAPSFNRNSLNAEATGGNRLLRRWTTYQLSITGNSCT